jgi:hypothetical protein
MTDRPLREAAKKARANNEHQAALEAELRAAEKLIARRAKALAEAHARYDAARRALDLNRR